MNISTSFIRLLFGIICVLFSVNFSVNYFEGGMNPVNVGIGLLGGFVLASVLLGFDFLLNRFNLRSLNTAALGLFFGYFLAQSILFGLSGMLGQNAEESAFFPLRFLIFLICAYIGIRMTLQAEEEIHLTVPFLEFKKITGKKKDVLVDLSILNDPRIIDLASTGLLDHRLIVPRYALKDLYTQSEHFDETIHAKARRSLEVIKKLESIPSLDLRYTETDFPDIKDPMTKMIRLARFMDTNIITSDINRIQQSSIEGVRIINIHMLSNALKPITQAGESINIKIQRYGKEARQGIGYLEDGTMVVVNGGAEFIGEVIKTHVLSVKHTSSGRMIFCNAAEEGCSPLDSPERAYSLSSSSEVPENHFSAL